MKKLSTDKDIDKFVRELLRSGWSLLRSKRHPVIKSPSGKRIAVPSSPGVSRAYDEFTHAVQRLQAQG
jgi:hypothetical protein